MQHLVSDYERILHKIPELFSFLATPHIEQVLIAFSPGLSILRWTSLSLSNFVTNVQSTLETFERLIDTVLGIHNNRILETFSQILRVPLVEVPSQDVITIESFVERTKELCQKAVVSLENKNLVIETAVIELLSILFPSKELVNSNETESSQQQLPDLKNPGALAAKRKADQRIKLQQEADLLHNYYQQLNVDTFIQLFRSTLESIRKRVAVASTLSYTDFPVEDKKEHHPLFVADVVLSLPNLIIRPSIDEIQFALSSSIQNILSVMKSIYCWGQDRGSIVVATETSTTSLKSQVKLLGSMTSTCVTSRLKTYHHAVTEHKEIVKLVIALGSSLSSTKSIVQSTVDQFNKYEILWGVDREEKVREFSESDPGVSDYQQEMASFQQLETSVLLEPDIRDAGALCLHTEQFKIMLVTEAKQWRVLYGRVMSQNYQSTMDKVFVSIEEWSKLLSWPLKDLDDVRTAMATLKEIRENEIRIDMCLGPIEVCELY